MGTISQLRDKIKALDIGFESEVAIEETREVIIEKQRNQLLHGLNSKGEKIGRYRNSKYALKKFAQNALAGFGSVDLKLTGSLYNKIFVSVRPGSFVIDSADEKTDELIKKYGDPFGLDSENKSAYIKETLRDKLLRQIKNKTGL